MKKRALTIIEIMIVILLIGLIGGAIGYNVKGSLKKGKEFKTKRAKAQLEDLLELCVQEGMNPKKVVEKPLENIKKLGIAKDPESLLKDGDGRPFLITFDDKQKIFHVDSHQ